MQDIIAIAKQRLQRDRVKRYRLKSDITTLKRQYKFLKQQERLDKKHIRQLIRRSR